MQNRSLLKIEQRTQQTKTLPSMDWRGAFILAIEHPDLETPEAMEMMTISVTVSNGYFLYVIVICSPSHC